MKRGQAEVIARGAAKPFPQDRPEPFASSANGEVLWPFKYSLRSCIPTFVNRGSDSTMNCELTAARTGLPMTLISRGTTPKEPTLPPSSKDRRHESSSGIRPADKHFTEIPFLLAEFVRSSLSRPKARWVQHHYCIEIP